MWRSLPSRWAARGWTAARLAVAAVAVALSVGATALAATPALAQASSPCTGAGVYPITLPPTLPRSFFLSGQQLGADCMAWQTFISLNWVADADHPGRPDTSVSGFGTPGDTRPTVWESYMEASKVFAAPTSKALWSEKRPAVKALTRLNKQGPTDLTLSNIGQATTTPGPLVWLTDQRGNLTYYEVRMNEDEYDFITQNGLTTFKGQADCIQSGLASATGKGGLDLPAGGGQSNQGTPDTDCGGGAMAYGTNSGAIEIKASWVILPADHSLDYRYKIAVAEISPPPAVGPPVLATVGLAGLHIIHKVPGAEQFVWATFEQIDNDPDENNGSYTAPVLPPNPHQKPRATASYTFFNPNCTSATDPTYQCAHNKLPNPPCDASGGPSGCDPLTAPMQVTRVIKVDATVANPVTGYAWSQFPSDSVFNYYRLIDVQWPSAQATPIAPGSRTPLSAGGITPEGKGAVLADSTLETFQQNKNSCMDCHKYAPVATASSQLQVDMAGRMKRVVLLTNLAVPAASATPAPHASDYSFIFSAETTR